MSGRGSRCKGNRWCASGSRHRGNRWCTSGSRRRGNRWGIGRSSRSSGRWRYSGDAGRPELTCLLRWRDHERRADRLGGREALIHDKRDGDQDQEQGHHHNANEQASTRPFRYLRRGDSRELWPGRSWLSYQAVATTFAEIGARLYRSAALRTNSLCGRGDGDGGPWTRRW